MYVGSPEKNDDLRFIFCAYLNKCLLELVMDYCLLTSTGHD